MSSTNAADNLQGLTLDTGWVVGPPVPRAPGATGGFFSVCYTATKNGRTCFLKAYNFAPFMNLATQHGTKRPIVDVLGDMLDAYRYERDLSALCQRSRVNKVAFVRDAGEHTVPGHTITVVPYLLFDIADGGDIRSRLSFASALESAWKLRSLHNVAVGLKQLHGIDVSHQDLKPSNVLLFKGESKIGDLGRSTCLQLPLPSSLKNEPFTGDYSYAPPEILYGAHGIDVSHQDLKPSNVLLFKGESKIGDLGRSTCLQLPLPSSLKNEPFTGDYSYAPPEILYGAHDSDWRKRSFACDLYLFGSLIVFYFSGLTMTGLLSANLDNSLSWEHYIGRYADVQPYILDAFSRALDAFAACITGDILREDLRLLVAGLCHPVPAHRAYGPRRLAGTPVDMDRVVTKLDVLAKRAAYTISREN